MNRGLEVCHLHKVARAYVNSYTTRVICTSIIILQYLLLQLCLHEQKVSLYHSPSRSLSRVRTSSAFAGLNCDAVCLVQVSTPHTHSSALVNQTREKPPNDRVTAETSKNTCAHTPSRARSCLWHRCRDLLG